MKCKVSIIVPMYNAQASIANCLDSLIYQTYDNTQIIVVNDGSKDNSYDICNRYVKEHLNIVLLNQANRGVSATRNVGIENATGEYIIFVDSDDYIEKDFVENLLEKIESNNADIAMCDYCKETNSRKILQSEFTFEKDIDFLDLDKNIHILYEAYILGRTSIFCLWNKIFKTDLIKEYGILFSTNLSHAEDFEFCIKYINKCHGFAYIKKILHHYVVNEQSITNTFHADQLLHHSQWMQILKSNIPSCVLKKNEKALLCTTNIELNDFLFRAKKNSMTIKYVDLIDNKDVCKMITELKIVDTPNISCKILLLSLKFKSLALYNMYLRLRGWKK